MQQKHIYPILSLILTLFIITSCQRTAPVTIAGKWNMQTAIGNYTVNGSNRKDTTKFTAGNYFEFKSDSTITIAEPAGVHNGRWKMLNNKLYITGTNYIDYVNGFDVTVLTSTDLQLYYTETNSFSFLEQKLNLTR